MRLAVESGRRIGRRLHSSSRTGYATRIARRFATLLLWTSEEVGHILKAGWMTRHLMIEAWRWRLLRVCAGRLQKLWRWTLELLMMLRNVHLREVWMATHPAWMLLLLLLVRWLSEVAALSCLLLLLLQEQ